MEIVLKQITATKNRVDYEFSADDEASIYFNGNMPFFVEYLCDLDLSNVPKSILAIPFITNVLTLSWVYGIELVIEEIDQDFFESIPEMKRGYQSIFKDVPLKGKIQCGKVVKNSYAVSDRAACLFSGGVDATFTFLRHRNEDLTLVNIWGVDIKLDDTAGHKEADKYFSSLAKSFQKEYICIKSSVREFLNEKYLNEYGYGIIGDYWWHGAQHSIGMLSLLAPYNYIYKNKTNYIASSFTEKELGQGVRCISYPDVDGRLKMSSTECFHDGFETPRIGKVKYICEIRRSKNYNLDLKVCFHYKEGKNCSQCEKCMRTIAAILVYDDHVEKYGFSPKCNSGIRLRNFLDTHEIGDFRWIPIQKAYQQNPVNKRIRWLSSYQFNRMNSLRSRILRLVMRRSN